jgi:hypothetical protein
MVLSLAPELLRWSPDEKAALRAIIVAKPGRTELRYMQLLNRHTMLRKMITRLGSAAL